MDDYEEYVTLMDRELMVKVCDWTILKGLYLIYANVSVNLNNILSILDKNIEEISEI
jgi:hypothetical protein